MRQGWLAVAALALHGPVDLGVTAAAFHLESNPLVLVLGLPMWLLVKVVAVTSAAVVWYVLRQDEETEHLAPILAALLLIQGVLLVLPNLIVIYLVG